MKFNEAASVATVLGIEPINNVYIYLLKLVICTHIYISNQCVHKRNKVRAVQAVLVRKVDGLILSYVSTKCG